MNKNLKRISISFLLGLLLAACTTELSYFFLKKENRAPETIELVIPSGTSDLVDAGQLPPELPKDMRFVLGDTLRVINQDDENHQLGPLWIPAGTSANLTLDTEQNMAVECSFQPGNYFGITVQEPVTWRTRISGMFFAGFPLGTIFALYSGLVFSENKRKRNEPSQ